MMVAVGSLAATEARAQENAAGSGATATPGQQDEESKTTVNADGTLSPAPNRMSKFLKRSDQFNNMPMEMPLVDDPREDGSGRSGQTN
jgi:hypothetical protein